MRNGVPCNDDMSRYNASNTLFGHLAQRFSSHPENLATEALLYLVSNSDRGNELFDTLPPVSGTQDYSVVRFSSQVTSEDQSVPDMVGYDADGNKVCIVENKFWAELTPNQPLGYIPQLSDDGTAALVFVCPERRVSVLNNELTRIIRNSGRYPSFEEHKKSDELIINYLTDTKSLIVTSWRHVLAQLERLLDPVREKALIEDLNQLNGLCEEMDLEGFAPLREHETGNLEIPGRILNYLNLIEEIFEVGRARNLMSGQGLQKTSVGTWSGRYVHLPEPGMFIARIALDFETWRKFGRSPIWMQFSFDGGGRGSEVAEIAQTSGFDFVDLRTSIAMPIFLLPNCEKQTLINDCLDQIENIVELISACGPRQD